MGALTGYGAWRAPQLLGGRTIQAKGGGQVSAKFELVLLLAEIFARDPHAVLRSIFDVKVER